MEGHLLAIHGGVSIDVSRMNKVLAIHAEDLTVTVQPGVTRKALNEALNAARVRRISWALAGVAAYADLPELAATLQMEIDDLFPVAESLHLLRFAELAEGDIRLTDDPPTPTEIDR